MSSLRKLMLQTREFADVSDLTAMQFSVLFGENTWYSLLVEDAMGKFLVSNPVWVKSSETGELSEQPNPAVNVKPNGNHY